jgi:putative hydrolases of HD superfamily
MAVMSMMLPETVRLRSTGDQIHRLDRNKCVIMSIVHDMAEAKVGDITPHCGVSKHDKHRMEREAMEEIVSMIRSNGSVMADEIYSLWLEYEEGKTVESIVVHDIDKFEMVIQADAYERRQPGLDLSQFFTSTEGIFESDAIRSWDSSLRTQRLNSHT